MKTFCIAFRIVGQFTPILERFYIEAKTKELAEEKAKLKFLDLIRMDTEEIPQKDK